MAVPAQKRSSRAGSSKNVVAAARGKRSGRSSAGSALWANVKSLLGALAIFLFVRAFLIEAFRIPSESMVPTLLVGDWLFVNKLVYGPNIPFTDVNLPGYAEPKRGEVVVFVSPPQDPSIRIAPDQIQPTLVKRIAGVPGDTIHMRRGLMYVNGIAQRQGYAAASNPVGGGDETSPLFEWQRQYALGQSRFGPAPARPTHDNWGPLVVPEERFFVLGDNRYRSVDSRYYGLVPRENVRGRPIFVYYSYNADDSDRALPFLTDIRWGRIGHRIR